MNTLVKFIFLFLAIDLSAQKDSLKHIGFSLDGGLILNNTYSHYDESDQERSPGGWGLLISPSKIVRPIFPGANIGMVFHFGKPMTPLPFVIGLSLSLTRGAYHENETTPPGLMKNGVYTQTTSYRDEKVTQLLLNYEFGFKTAFSKRLYMQNTLILQQNLYSWIHKTGYSITSTWSGATGGQTQSLIDNTETIPFSVHKGLVTVSYKFALYFKLNRSNKPCHVFASRSFSLSDYKLPLWNLGLRYFLK